MRYLAHSMSGLAAFVFVVFIASSTRTSLLTERPWYIAALYVLSCAYMGFIVGNAARWSTRDERN